MLPLLKALLLLPVALVVVLLSIANRAPVTVSLDPFTKGAPEFAVAVPLYGLLLGALALGVLIGGLGSWLAGGRHRRVGRASRREVHRLRQETDRLRTNLATTARSPAALPSPRSAA